jgi:2-methylcitrate dehydratase PrpD
MSAAGTDLVGELAEFVVGARYPGVPPDAVDAAKKSILDTLGVMLAASGLEPAVRPVIDLVRETGGRPEATIVAFGGRAPAIMAAFANGAMSHTLDYDDQTPWGQHASSSIVPAAFAIAERRGGVSGADMLTAVAVGQDIFARLRCNVGWRKDWNLSTVIGVFAAAATAGHLLSLSRQQMISAWGAATMQAGGLMELVAGVGGDLRGIYAAFSAKAAVIAALLADKGVTGVETLFEGRYGFFNTYFAGSYDRANMLAGLGTDYRGSGTLYKRWPSVGTSHSHIHATIDLATRYDLSAGEIEELRLHVGDYHELMCRPLDARRAPKTLVDAKFSLPFLVSVAAARRDLRLLDLSASALEDPDVLALARRVVVIPDASLDWKTELPPGRVEIVMRNGRTFEQVGVDVPGSATAPLSWDDLGRKFADCASLAVVPVPSGRIEAFVQMVHELESLDDATRLLHVLAAA